MSDILSKATQRLSQTKDFFMGKIAMAIHWDPNSTYFPLRKDLPKIRGAPDDAAWVWGEDDYVGRLNLLTPARVKAAAAEVKTGEMARLDLPLDIPSQPAFGREKFEHSIKVLTKGVAYDDLYTLNVGLLLFPYYSKISFVDLSVDSEWHPMGWFPPHSPHTNQDVLQWHQSVRH